METFGLTPSVPLPMRPVIMSTPLAGTVELSLPIQHAGVLYLAQVAWRCGDPLETTDVLLDPEPPAHRDLLAVLDKALGIPMGGASWRGHANDRWHALCALPLVDATLE